MKFVGLTKSQVEESRKLHGSNTLTEIPEDLIKEENKLNSFLLGLKESFIEVFGFSYLSVPLGRSKAEFLQSISFA